VKEANRKNLSMIAITDHNTAENVEAVIKVAEKSDLYVIPGIEICTSEEVHIIALFNTIENSRSMQELIFSNLQPGENDEDLFGMQVIANEFDEVEGFNKRLLISATTLDVNTVVDTIHKLEGIALAAHIDRESYSLIGQLGFIPPDLKIDAIEISKNITIIEAKKRFKEYGMLPFITSSDSHELDDVGVSFTQLQLESTSFNELYLALYSANGRQVL
ncbi:MAG: PHP domain-containing protein, partial [Spirochaetota bacterium]|nr:PHP domain-containing protein [Spirochaetota bacterium]